MPCIEQKGFFKDVIMLPYQVNDNDNDNAVETAIGVIAYRFKKAIGKSETIRVFEQSFQKWRLEPVP